MSYSAWAGELNGDGSTWRKGVAFGKAAMAEIPGGATKLPNVLLLPESQTPSQWSDLSGNDRHYAQATSAKQPAAGTLAGTSGVAALRFDGSDDILLSAYTPTGALGEVWAIWDGEDAESGGWGGVWTTADEAEAGLPGTGYNRQLCIPYNGDRHPWIVFTPDNDPNTTYFSAGGTVNDGTPYLTRWRSTDTAYKIALNGVDQTLTKRSGVNGSNDGDWWSMVASRDNSAIGGHKRSIETDLHKGGVAVLLLWDGLNLSDEEAAAWSRFLMAACRVS